jgi:hypothetical protein
VRRIFSRLRLPNFGEQICPHSLLANNLESALKWALQQNQIKKPPHFSAVIGRCLWEFLRIYFLQLGFISGRKGLIYAALMAQSVFYKYAIFYSLSHDGLGSHHG